MKYKYVFNQSELEYAYEEAKSRMAYHPDIAKKNQEIIQGHSHFEVEKDALEAAILMEKDNPHTYQIWAKMSKDEEFYRIDNWWIVSNQWRIKQAAEYIGMVLVYDEDKLEAIIKDKTDINKVINNEGVI